MAVLDEISNKFTYSIVKLRKAGNVYFRDTRAYLNDAINSQEDVICNNKIKPFMKKLDRLLILSNKIYDTDSIAKIDNTKQDINMELSYLNVHMKTMNKEEKTWCQQKVKHLKYWLSTKINGRIVELDRDEDMWKLETEQVNDLLLETLSLQTIPHYNEHLNYIAAEIAQRLHDSRFYVLSNRLHQILLLLIFKVGQLDTLPIWLKQLWLDCSDSKEEITEDAIKSGAKSFKNWFNKTNKIIQERKFKINLENALIHAQHIVNVLTPFKSINTSIEFRIWKQMIDKWRDLVNKDVIDNIDFKHELSTDESSELDPTEYLKLGKVNYNLDKLPDKSIIKPHKNKELQVKFI